MICCDAGIFFHLSFCAVIARRWQQFGFIASEQICMKELSFFVSGQIEIRMICYSFNVAAAF